MKKFLAILVAAMMLFGIFGGALAQPAKRSVAPANNGARAIKTETVRSSDRTIGKMTRVKAGETLDEALNISGGTIAFVSEGDYPWQVLEDEDTGRVYAQSTNAGVSSSTSTVSATVEVGSNKAVKFDFKAWGEGSSTAWDKCIFSIDGNAQFTYGAKDNDWEEYVVNIGSGTHTLTWTYSKDSSVNPSGDYFAVDNVQIVEREAIPDDPELDAAVNAEGGNIHFHTGGTYPWTVVEDDVRAYAANGNSGVHSSESVMTATVTANTGDIISFEFKAWGEGTSTFWDHCDFYVDGTRVMYYGAYNNEDWETFYTELTAGEHELKWSFTKDGTDNGAGDYFYVDNVKVSAPVAVTSIEAPASIDVPMYRSAAIEYTVLPADATNKAVTFTVADDSVAKVDADGTVHGLAIGTTTVTIASVNYPDVTATVTVNVYDSGIVPVEIYAIAAYDPSEAANGQWIRFYDVDPTTIEPLGTAPDAYAAAFAYGTVYGYTTGGDFFSAPADDLTNVTTIATGATTYTMIALAMNYVDGIMYGLGVNSSDAIVLVMVDMETGAIVDVGALTTECINLAIDENGNAYGISFEGDLNSIDLATGEVTVIGNTGMNVNYVQGMCYDFNTGDLYWAQYYNTGDSGLCRVNKADGSCEYIDFIGGEIETCGLFIIPDEEPEPPADIPVTGVTINPTEVEIRVGDTATFTAMVTPVNASNKAVEWDVDDDEILAIDQNGTVLGLAEGTATVYVTTDDGAFTAYAVVNVLPPLGDFICGYYFETDPAADGWQFIDDDGDGYNWGWDTSTFTPYEGSGIIYSNSYVNYVGAVEPDNWAVSPLVILPDENADVTLYVAGQDPSYASENFALYVGLTDDIYDMVKVGGDFTATGEYVQYSASLADYAGQAVYFAIRHYNVTDMYVLDVDQVEFWGTGTFQGAHQLTITYQYDDGTEAAPTYTATLPEGFNYSVTSPFIEGYIADIDVVEGVMGEEDIAVTVTYVSDGSVTVAGWYFETDPAEEGWTFVDDDGDGFNWVWQENYDNPPYCTAYEGEGLIYSQSYDNDTSTALEPDNWAISPAVELPTLDALVYLYACGQDESYAAEHFAIYAGTTPNIEDMVMVSAEFVATGEYTRYEADLTAFAGETVYIAIRHFNVTDMFYLNVDNVVVKGHNGDTPPAPVLGDLDGDGVVTFLDVSIMSLFLSGEGEIAEEYLPNADFNQDGEYTYADLSDMYLFLIG